MTHRTRAVAAALALTAALSACASIDDTLRDAADTGVAAVGSSAIAAEQHESERLLGPPTDTVFSDAIAELTDASRAVLELTPADADAADRRDDVEHALREALDVVTGARAALARGDALDGWAERLRAARDGLEGAAG